MSNIVHYLKNKIKISDIEKMKEKDREISNVFKSVVLQDDLYDLFHHITLFASGALMASDSEIDNNIQKLKNLIGTEYYDGKLDYFFYFIINWLEDFKNKQ